MPTRSSRRLFAVGLSLAAILATPVALLAHAHLVRSAPAAGATLDKPPQSIELWFSEHPELAFTSVRLLDSAGASVPLAAPTNLEQNGVSLAVGTTLAPGAYTVVWRTAASDGHPTNGKFSFRVGAQAAAAPAPAPAPAASVTVQPAGPAQSQGESTPAVPTPVRWAEFIGVLVLIGTIVFRLVVLPKAGWPADATTAVAARVRRLAFAAILLYLITTIARVALQSQLLAGATSGSAAVMAVVRDTRWGHGWLTGAVGAVIAIAGLAAAGRRSAGWFTAAFGAVLVCVGEALTGHAVAVQHTALSVAADVTHVLGAGSWIGTLAVLLAFGLPALDSMRDSDVPAAGGSLARAYHTAAVDGVVLVVLSGVIAACLRLPSFSALWTTDYGSWLYRKIVFVLIALGFGAYHWRRVVTREWSGDTRRRFARTALGELVVGLVIVAFTSVLVSSKLPS